MSLLEYWCARLQQCEAAAEALRTDSPPWVQRVTMLQIFQFLLEYTKNATDASQISDWEVYVALVSGLVQAVIAVMSWMSVRFNSFLHIVCY